MAFLAAAVPYIAAGATAISAASAYSAGQNQKQQAQIIAQQQEDQGKREMAASILEANQERKKARFVKSRARAVAAASGAGASDPTVEDIMAGIDAEGEYNAMMALSNGSYLNQGRVNQAAASRSAGAAYGRAGTVGAFTTALNGTTSWFDKYN
jgi:hypothetical protein